MCIQRLDQPCKFILGSRLSVLFGTEQKMCFALGPFIRTVYADVCLFDYGLLYVDLSWVADW